MNSEIKIKISLFQFEILIFSILYLIFSIWISSAKIVPKEEISEKQIKRLVNLAEGIKFNHNIKHPKSSVGQNEDVLQSSEKDVLVKKEHEIYSDKHEPPPAKETENYKKQQTGFNGDLGRFGVGNREASYSSTFSFKQQSGDEGSGSISRMYSKDAIIGRDAQSGQGVSRLNLGDLFNKDKNNGAISSNLKKQIDKPPVELDKKEEVVIASKLDQKQDKLQFSPTREFTEVTSILNQATSKLGGSQISINSMKRLYDRIDNIKKKVRSKNITISNITF